MPARSGLRRLHEWERVAILESNSQPGNPGSGAGGLPAHYMKATQRPAASGSALKATSLWRPCTARRRPGVPGWSQGGQPDSPGVSPTAQDMADVRLLLPDRWVQSTRQASEASSNPGWCPGPRSKRRDVEWTRACLGTRCMRKPCLGYLTAAIFPRHRRGCFLPLAIRLPRRQARPIPGHLVAFAPSHHTPLPSKARPRLRLLATMRYTAPETEKR